MPIIIVIVKQNIAVILRKRTSCWLLWIDMFGWCEAFYTWSALDLIMDVTLSRWVSFSLKIETTSDGEILNDNHHAWHMWQKWIGQR